MKKDADFKKFYITQEDPHIKKEALIISFDSIDNIIENAIYIPISEKKRDCDDYTVDSILISISKKLIALNDIKHIFIYDTTNWYSSIIQNLSNAITKNRYDTQDATVTTYVDDIMRRNVDLV